MLVSCHAALTTEKTEPAGQEQKLIEEKKSLFWLNTPILMAWGLKTSEGVKTHA